MNIEDQQRFRSEVRAFIEQTLPAVVRNHVLLGKSLDKETLIDWHRHLFRKGWVAPCWPTEFGGTGWSIRQRWVFEEECALSGAPAIIPMGITTVGPMLIGSASEEQRARYLPAILDGSAIWCQGFSEPGAGSDLASLCCRAMPVDGGYRITGTKIWTTQAHWADKCLILARTSQGARKQEGISLLIADMHQPTITVRPIRSLDGLHVLNQLFFDDHFVPAEDLIGAEGEAWDILKSNIGHERVLNANIGLAKVLRARLLHTAFRTGPGGRRPADLPGIMDRVAGLEVRLIALEATALQVLDLLDLPVTPQASMLKIRGTELQQDYARLIGDVLGDASLPFAPETLTDIGSDPEGFFDPITPNYLFLRKTSISAGTNEIQRDIIARHVLR